MNSIYKKEVLKKVFKIIFLIIAIIVVLWGVIFLIDYLLYKKTNQTIFTITKIQNVNEGYITYQKGLGYKYISENDNTKLYIFGKEIK